jgi:hypothetical protein
LTSKGEPSFSSLASFSSLLIKLCCSIHTLCCALSALCCRYTHVVWGEGLGRYVGGTVMYATQAPAESNDDEKKKSIDDNVDDLSHSAVIAMSVILSFVAGAVIAGLVLWFWMSYAKGNSLLV